MLLTYHLIFTVDMGRLHLYSDVLTQGMLPQAKKQSPRRILFVARK